MKICQHQKHLAIMNEKKITSLLVVSDKDFKKKNKNFKRNNSYSFSITKWNKMIERKKKLRIIQISLLILGFINNFFYLFIKKKKFLDEKLFQKKLKKK